MLAISAIQNSPSSASAGAGRNVSTYKSSATVRGTMEPADFSRGADLVAGLSHLSLPRGLIDRLPLYKPHTAQAKRIDTLHGPLRPAMARRLVRRIFRTNGSRDRHLVLHWEAACQVENRAVGQDPTCARPSRNSFSTLALRQPSA